MKSLSIHKPQDTESTAGVVHYLSTKRLLSGVPPASSEDKLPFSERSALPWEDEEVFYMAALVCNAVRRKWLVPHSTATSMEEGTDLSLWSTGFSPRQHPFVVKYAYTVLRAVEYHSALYHFYESAKCGADLYTMLAQRMRDVFVSYKVLENTWIDLQEYYLHTRLRTGGALDKYNVADPLDAFMSIAWQDNYESIRRISYFLGSVWPALSHTLRLSQWMQTTFRMLELRKKNADARCPEITARQDYEKNRNAQTSGPFPTTYKKHESIGFNAYGTFTHIHKQDVPEVAFNIPKYSALPTNKVLSEISPVLKSLICDNIDVHSIYEVAVDAMLPGKGVVENSEVFYSVVTPVYRLAAQRADTLVLANGPTGCSVQVAHNRKRRVLSKMEGY